VSLKLFAPSPLPRIARSVSYYPDLIFQISLAAEMLHHWPFLDPSVSGQSLHYHIFVNIDMAAVEQVTRVDLATIALRLQPSALIGLIGIQLFVLGRRVGGSAASGLVAATLGLFAGELNFSERNLFGGGASVLGFLDSPSYELGAVFFLAIAIVLCEGLAGNSRSRGHGLTFIILAFAAVGAKSSVVPILACGLILFALGRIAARHEVTAHDVSSLIVLFVAGAIGYVLLYRGGGQGVVFKPLDFVAYTGLAPLYRHAGHTPLYALAAMGAAAVVLCGSMPSLAGIGLSGSHWRSREHRDSPERLLMCIFAASLPPFLLLSVPGDSEVYFVVYGYLAAIVVSSVGIVKAAARLRLGPGPLALSGIVWALCGLAMLAESYQLAAPTLGSWLRGLSAVQPSGANSDRGITADLWRGLVWIRTHTPPSDVIAVNNHYLERGGDSRYFYYSAITERRVFLQSWEYTTRGYEYLSRDQTATPFPGFLALNEAAVSYASPSAIATLYGRYDVRYIVIDRLHGPSPAGLSRLTRVVYSNPDITVFRIA